MSLCDALLIEPPIPNLALPRQEVWLAVRTDGITGDGSQSNPFNCASLPSPRVTIGQLTSNQAVATVIVAPGTDFRDGDWVTIVGVKISAGYPNDIYYHGTFQAFEVDVQSGTFKVQLLGTPSQSEVTTDYDVPFPGLFCWREREPFDAIMRQMPENSVIHLGAGVFETKGDAGGVAGGWFVKDCQRIIGSGMGLTTLKLVGCSVRHGGYSIISNSPAGGGFLTGFELSDLTLDCNADGPLPNPWVNVCAVSFYKGSRHVRLRRVRGIHYGSRNSENLYRENFPFATGASASTLETCCDIRYEDCVGEWRSPNGSTNSTVFHLGGGEAEADRSTYKGSAKNYWHTGCCIRNNAV